MNRTRIFEIGLGVTVAAAMACAPSVGTIDRTQPNAIDKQDFEGLWYHRATIVESDPEAGYTEGITSNMDKIRWDITEDLLIGYRSYEFVPYAEGLTDDGRDFFGAPVAAFRILSHFDIQRDYNASTGVENNVIVENTTDRPWFERRYMRVDWSQNMIGRPTPFWIGWSNYPDGYFSGTALGKYYVQGHEATNPDRPIFTENYFDVTNVYNVEPDFYYCAYMLLFNGVPRCGAANVKVRLSFRKVDPTNDYEALYYPDVIDLKDDSGNAIVLNYDGRECGDSYDPSDCSIRTYPYDEKFGNFRTMRVAFDRERYLTKSGRIYVAGRFDLWQDSYNDEDGALRPYTDRTPQPIVYYGNVAFPDEMIPAAQKMASFYNVPFSEVVAYRQNKCVDENGARIDCIDGNGQPVFGAKPDVNGLRQEMGVDMFQFRQNDCNPANIVAYAEANGLMDVVNEVAGSSDRVARGNVEQVCAAVQYAELQAGKTLDPKVAERDKVAMAFNWQRKGDLRYSFQNYITQVQPYGPWGVAQFGQDPETGEFLANNANYFGDAGDVITQREVDMLQWLNGDLTEDEYFRGDIARETVISRRSVKNNSIRQAVKQALMSHEGDMMDESGDDLFPQTRPGAEDERRKAMFANTDIERELLMTDELLRGLAGPTLYQPAGLPLPNVGVPGAEAAGLGLIPGVVSEDAMQAASVVNLGLSPETNAYEQMVLEFGKRAFDLADFFSIDSTGLAEHVKGWTREQIFDFLKAELYTAVNGHEVGHTVGLRHNFQASMDPLNYRPEFWYKTNDDGTIEQFWNNPSSATNPNRATEYKYASIMDYGFGVSLEGLHGLGSYDEAAIRFQYGQLVDAWNPNKISIPDPRKYGSWSRRCGHDDDFLGLPALMWWLDPSQIPSVLSSTAKDQAPCAGDYDNNDTCDSEIDALTRELVTRMEATANRLNLPSQCAVWYNISDLNWILDVVKDLEPNAQNVYGGRMTVPVEYVINQRAAVLTNPPEYDDPGTSADESRDGMDNDGDGAADDKGYDWSRYLYEVDYGYCSDIYAGYSNPFCQRWDTGWDFQEMVDAHINRWDRDYIQDHFRRDAYSASGWGNPRAYISRLLSRRFRHLTNVFRYYLYTRRTAFQAPLFQDWAEAAYRGANFLERVLQSPEPGTYCLDTAANEYKLWDGSSACPEQLDLGLGYGEGLHLNTSWTNEYYYKANRIGAFYDKWAAIYQLTTSSGFFIRDLSDLFDRRAFSLGYLRVYEDPMIQRFAALIKGDSTGYTSRVVTDADTNEKFVRYMPLFDEQDEEGGSIRQALEPLPKIKPAWSWTLQYLSLYYAIGNWSSINDYALEFYRLTKIAIKGTPEDVIYDTSMPIEEFTDPETLTTYRAPCIAPRTPTGLVQEFPMYYGDRAHQRQGKFHDWGVGCSLLEDANTYLTNVWQPREAACRTSGSATSQECGEFHAARRSLNEKVGFIDIVRKFNRRAEGW